MTDDRQLIRNRLGLQLLIGLHIVASCISLVFISQIYPQYHILYASAGLPGAVAIMTAFALLSVLFIFAEFSFGYFIGYYFYMMITGYLWLNHFSEFNYNHLLAGFSAAASAAAFLLPALFICSPARQIWKPSSAALDLILHAILLLAVVTCAIGASYNFKILTPERATSLSSDIYTFRDTLKFPTILNYLIGIVSGVLLPFAFACFLEQKRLWHAAAVLVVLLLFHPITLNKLALFSPAWIVAIALLARLVEARLAVALSLLAPLFIGIVLVTLLKINAIPTQAAIPYFSLVNFRMIAIPSMAMDYYNEFFSKNDLTYFCQITFLKRLVSCPYQETLGLVIYNAFGIGGNFNASLFATEGIASVGVIFAPLSALACGLVIALGNRLAAGLPPRFILVSGAILPQVLLNIPFTVSLLTHGAGILFLLWYVTPRAMFEGRATSPPEPAG